MTYRQLVKEAEKRLEKTDVSENTAKLFMYELLEQRGINMYAEDEKEADPEIAEIYEQGLNRLMEEEPLAYVLGYQWFYGRRIRVKEDVFIPRYETEELCANVLALIDEHFTEAETVVADVACGSGAIAITLKKEEERLKVYATDLSEKALESAGKSAEDNEADICFLQGDLLEPLKKKGVRLDVLVCNPPYIAEDEILDRSVKDYEPHMALFGGKDGLNFYRRLLKEAPEVIREKALIAFEIGYTQKEALLELARQEYPNDRAEVLSDMKDCIGRGGDGFLETMTSEQLEAFAASVARKMN